MEHSIKLRLGLAFGLVFLSLLSPSHSQHLAALETSMTHGPVVGAVTASTAKIFVRTSAVASVMIRYSKYSDLADARDSHIKSTTLEHDFTTNLRVKGLEPSTVYYFDVLVDGVSQNTAPFPRFKTFPNAGASVPFKFAVLTDFGTNDSTQLPLARPVATFNSVDAEQPDFVIIGGDFWHNYYNSLTDKRGAFKAMYSLASPLGFFDDFVLNIQRHYSLAHMWDDHDMGKNDANKTYPYKERTLQVLEEFFPVYPVSAYGDWQTFHYGQADFFLLDSRSQRDNKYEPDGPNKSMLDGDNLGAIGQLEWLKQRLVHSTATWKFIVSPVAFNPTLGKVDGWNGFQYERRALVAFIHHNNITGVVVLSGDSHIGAIDDGTTSDFLEMLSPGPNLARCSTVKLPGTWSNGIYWTGRMQGDPCNGYGLVTVKTNPARIKLQVKDELGAVKLYLNSKIK